MPDSSVSGPLRRRWPRSSRLRATLAATVPALALLSAALAPPARASSLSTDPISSWGAARAGSRSQRVNAVVEADGVAYFGGYFTRLVGPGGHGTASRSRLAAIDASTGDLTSWNPGADGTVWAMELSADGRSVYLGGDFKHVDGHSVSRLAKVDLRTGHVDTSFRPKVDDRVRGLALDGGRLYLAGDFSEVDGQGRPKLAAVDADRGDLLPWAPPPLGPGRYVGHTGIPTPGAESGDVYAVEVVGDTVFAAGHFLDLGGAGGLVALDPDTGARVGPDLNIGRPVFDLDTSDGLLFAVAGGPGGRAYAIRPGEKQPVWSAKFDGDAVGVASSGGAVYVMGHYDYIVGKKSSCYQLCPGGPTRHHLSAFTADAGELLPWNPAADTSTGPFTAAVGAGHLYVGGEFNRINGEAHPGLAVFPGPP